MKLKIFILATFLLMYRLAITADKYEDTRYQILWENLIKYEIKAMKVTEIDYEFGVPLNFGFIKKDYKFDTKLNVIESKYYKKEDYKGKFMYEYNSNDDTLKITNYNDDNEEIFRVEFKYDQNGFLVEKNNYKENEFFYKEEFTNDNKGNILEYKKLFSDKMDFGFKYKYNTNGDEIEYEGFNEDTIKEMHGISNYNDKGLKTDSTYFFEDMEDLKVEFSYEKNNRLIERKTTSAKLGFLERFTFKYNPKGQLIEEKRFDDQDIMVEMHTLSYRDDDQIEKIEIYEEKEFLVGIWRFNYHLNGLLRDEHYYNKLDIPQFLRQYDYEPVQE